MISIVIDSSVLLAIILGEPDRDRYIDFLEDRVGLRVPASVLVEAGIAAERRNSQAQLQGLFERLQPEIVPLTASIAELAVAAFRNFGKGMHKAGLNFGDCMTYATAEYLKAPLLFKGNDFALTPILSALDNTRLA